jgi:hypothetical protein
MKMEQMEQIAKQLKIANEYGLLVECVYFALYRLKENPDLDIEDAMEIGVQEWIK